MTRMSLISAADGLLKTEDRLTERVLLVALAAEQNTKVDLMWAIDLVKWQGTYLASFAVVQPTREFSTVINLRLKWSS